MLAGPGVSLPWQAHNVTRQFEPQQCLLHDIDRLSHLSRQRLDAVLTGCQRIKQRGPRRGNARIVAPWRQLYCLCTRCLWQVYFQFIDHILGRAHQTGTISQQRKTTRAAWICDLPRYGEDIPTLLSCQAGRHQSPASLWRLDDDDRQSKTAHDSVALRKTTTFRRRSHGRFGQ